MSILRTVVPVGLCCLLLAGCAPVTGVKSIIAIVATLVAVGAAAWGLNHDRDEDRVAQKSLQLDKRVTEHTDRYH